MTFDEFKATKEKTSDNPLADYDVDLEAEAYYTYGKSAAVTEGFLIHEAEGKFWVHAWWYAPRPYDSLEEAEEKLYPWYLEFA